MSAASKGATPTNRTGDLAQGANYFGVPKNVRDANKRLSGPGPWDVNDKKTVIDYYKGQKGKA